MRHKFDNWDDAMSCAAVLTKPIAAADAPKHPRWRPAEKVVGSDIRWKPVDKTAALVISRAPYWALPPAPQPIFAEQKAIPKAQPSRTHKPKKRKEHTKMSKNGVTVSEFGTGNVGMESGNYVSAEGIRISKVNGQTMFNAEDVRNMVVRTIHEFPRQTSPQVRAAEDAKKIVAELVHGLGGEMEKFEAQAKIHCDQIRGKRMTMVTEAAQMTSALKEIRQFFLGSDYKEEIARLAEFVDLCERLQRLKESGFMDSIADTMLTLSVGKGQNHGR
jgi:hypothetical protein